MLQHAAAAPLRGAAAVPGDAGPGAEALGQAATIGQDLGALHLVLQCPGKMMGKYDTLW